MSDNFLENAIRRTSRNLFVTGMVLLVAGIVGVARVKDDVLNLIHGPTLMSAAAVDALTQVPGAPRYVRIHVDAKPGQIGKEVETDGKTGEEVETTAHILMAPVGQTIVLIKAPLNWSGADFTGVFEPMSSDTRKAVDEMSAGSQVAVLPIVFNANSDFVTSTLKASAIPFILILLGAVLAMKGSARMADPERHPVSAQLARFGNVRQVIGDIDADARVDIDRVGTIWLTSSWLIQTTAYGINLMKMQDLVWFYERVTGAEASGAVTTKGNYAIILFDRSGLRLETGILKEHIEGALELIGQHAPWAINGFSREIEQAWIRDREAFLRRVDERKNAGTAAPVRNSEFQPS